MTDKEMIMMEQLEEARRVSEHGYLIIAMGNGEEILWLYGGVANTDMCVSVYKAMGYWVVNQFINGQPVGLGI